MFAQGSSKKKRSYCKMIKTEEDDDMLEDIEGISMFDGDELDAAVYQRTDYEQGQKMLSTDLLMRHIIQSMQKELSREKKHKKIQPRMREEINPTQKHDDGVVQGRSMASEDIRAQKK